MTAVHAQFDAVELLPLHCPFATAIHPHADEIERHCVAWIDRFGLYSDAAQRERLIATRAAEVYARALPTADAERVADVAKWLYWGFATDDLYYDNGPTSRRTADFLALVAPLVRLAEEPRAAFAFELPYNAALRDLTRAILRHATPMQRIEWVQTARAWFFGMAWDVANAERGTPPSLNDYLAMRMHTGGLASWATTLNIANGIELTPAQAASGPVRALIEAWSTFCLLLNDLMSFAKEARNGDSSSNVVTVLAHEHGCTPQEAIPAAHATCDRIATLFVALHERLLEEAAARHDTAMERFLASLGHTWRGILDWGFRTPRYATGGDRAAVLQTFPGWAKAPTDACLDPLPHPSISWWWEERMTRVRDLAQRARGRRAPEPPPLASLRPRLPYPDGWFAVSFADELRPGGVLRRRFMGEDLVVYRTRSGLVRVVEPYCPHLGAHLGHGGRIDGEEIVCPFHHFAFGPDGACVRTGYGTRPPAMRLTRREVREVNGAIFVWHHAHGAPPAWEIPVHSTDGFPTPFRDVSTLVDHPQEVVENAVDIGHIGPLHGYRNARVRRSFEGQGPAFTVAAAAQRTFPLYGTVEVVFDIVVHGLGHIWVDATIPRLRTAAVFQAMATPLDPLRVEIRFSVALRASGRPTDSHTRLLLSRLLTIALGPAFRRDQMQDVPVWQHKVYVAQPRLAKGDGPIPAYRRWAQQFYSRPTATDGDGTPALTGGR